MNVYPLKRLWIILIFLLLAGCGQVKSPNPSVVAPSSPESLATIEPSEENLPQPNPPEDVPCKRIVFVLARGDKSDIISACPDGSDLQNLTNSGYFNSTPAWSPDGDRIAFSSNREGDNQIFVMNADGSGVTRITNDYQNDFPVWLPEGDQVAFRTTDGKGLWWWRIVNIETSQVTQFSQPTYDFFFQTPAWSPDVQRIAYMSLEEQKQRNDGSSQIHVQNIDGSEDVALTHDTWANINPVWSPDGKKIAFLSERDGTYNKFALYVMTADGKNIEKLTDPDFSEICHLSWSPDGTSIAIDSDLLDGNIYIIDLDSDQQAELLPVREGERAFFPSWQP